jgi:hypothetical protein
MEALDVLRREHLDIPTDPGLRGVGGRDRGGVHQRWGDRLCS